MSPILDALPYAIISERMNELAWFFNGKIPKAELAYQLLVAGWMQTLARDFCESTVDLLALRMLTNDYTHDAPRWSAAEREEINQLAIRNIVLREEKSR